MDKPIISLPSATMQQAKAWAISRNAAEVFVQLADLYWELASQHGGIDPAVAYAQSAEETGYGRFGGVIDASYHNPCGLKTRSGGGNQDPNAHHRFRNWREGVAAHLDHLALYAGAPNYPRPNSPDPRHFPWLHGTAQTLYALSGKWAPSNQYGQKIDARHLAPMQAMSVPLPEVQSEAQLVINNKSQAGYLIQNRLYVPVRFISEELNIKITWNNQTKTARIEDE